MRRHRLGVTAALFVALALVAGLIASGALYWHAERLRRDADAQRALAERQRVIADHQRAEAESERANADANAARAEHQRLRADGQTAIATEALQLAEREVYFSRVDLADREWRAASITRCNELLATAPPRLRDWEWHHLSRVAKVGHWTVKLPSGGAVATAFSADNRQIFVVNVDMTLLHLDGRTGQELKRVPLGRGTVDRASFSNDGRLIAGQWQERGSTQRRFTVWETATGRPRLQLPGASRMTFALAPSGAYVATVFGVRTTLQVWSTETAARIADFVDAAGIRSLAFSPDGSRIAVTGRPYLKVIDALTGRTVSEMLAAQDSSGYFGLQFSIDGKLLIEWNLSGGMRMWRVDDGTAAGTFQFDGRINLAADTRAGILTLLSDRTLRIVNRTTGRELWQLPGHESVVTALAISGDGERIVSSAMDGSLTMRSLPMASEPVSLDAAAVVFGAVLTDAGRVVAITHGGVKMWRAPNAGVQSLFPLTSKSYAGPLARRWLRVDANREGVVAFQWPPRIVSDDGQVPGADGVMVVDSGTGRIRAVLAPAVAPRQEKRPATFLERRLPQSGHVTLNQQSTRVALVSSHSNGFGLLRNDTIEVWHVATGGSLWRLSTTTSIGKPIFSPDGRVLAVASGSVVIVHDAATGRILKTLRHATGPLAFSGDGRLLATGAAGHGAAIWETATWSRRSSLPRHASALLAIALSPTGHRAVTRSADDTIRMFETSTGRDALLLSTAPHASSVEELMISGAPGFDDGRLAFAMLTFSPDGRRVVQTSYLTDPAGVRMTRRTWDGSPSPPARVSASDPVHARITHVSSTR